MARSCKYLGISVAEVRLPGNARIQQKTGTTRHRRTHHILWRGAKHLGPGDDVWSVLVLGHLHLIFLFSANVYPPPFSLPRAGGGGGARYYFFGGLYCLHWAAIPKEVMLKPAALFSLKRISQNTFDDDQLLTHKRRNRRIDGRTAAKCNGTRPPPPESRGLPCPTEGCRFHALNFAAHLTNTISHAKQTPREPPPPPPPPPCSSEAATLEHRHGPAWPDQRP